MDNERFWYNQVEIEVTMIDRSMGLAHPYREAKFIACTKGYIIKQIRAIWGDSRVHKTWEMTYKFRFLDPKIFRSNFIKSRFFHKKAFSLPEKNHKKFWANDWRIVTLSNMVLENRKNVNLHLKQISWKTKRNCFYWCLSSSIWLILIASK
jgi:hypothetical protein